MYDIFDYLYWRGDLSFKERAFNEIDNLIMSRISYLPLDKVLTKKMTIKEAYNKSLDIVHLKDFYHENDFKIFKIMSQSGRYKDLLLSDFVNIIDKKKEQQFCAVTITLPGIMYISYRGTDNTLIGFKEDFNMAFLDVVPSQIEALNYLNKVSNNPFYKLMVGGHSKGGNLAIYASLYCKQSIKNRIISVFNNDGPGFLKEVTDTKFYKELKPRIHTFIPKTSIVGRLLNNSNYYKVVDSKEKYILQHDIYSWILVKDDFRYVFEVDKDSEKIYRIINDWVSKVDLEERKKFVNLLYKMLSSTNVKVVEELDDNIFKTIKALGSTYIGSSKEEKELLNKVFEYFIKAIKDNLIEKKEEV